MALDYITNPTGVFFRAGKFVKKINSYLSLAQTTYPADFNEIALGYNQAFMEAQIDGLPGYYTGLQNAVTTVRQSLARYIDKTITDRVTVLEKLGVQSPDPNLVLAAMLQDMLDNAQTIKKCTVTVGSVTPSASNVGNGTVLVTKILDGSQAPLIGALPNIRYNGLNSELAVTSETMTLVCTADSQTGGAQEGGERFSWNGNIAPQTLDWLDEGSGQGPSVTVMNGQSLLNDGSFENWQGAGNNTPSSWTITGGTAGTNIFRGSGAGNVHRGTYSLQLTGDGATATIGVAQLVNVSGLKPRQRYVLSGRIRSSGVPASGQINILFSGTGYTAAGSEQISIAAASFPTSAFTSANSLFNFSINLPFPLPSDGTWQLNIQITGTLSNGVSVYFDSFALKTVDYHGGVGLVACAGSNRFAKGDKFTFSLTNDAAGVWQSFMRRYYRFQLPSTTAGMETISDALAT